MLVPCQPKPLLGFLAFRSHHFDSGASRFRILVAIISLLFVRAVGLSRFTSIREEQSRRKGSMKVVRSARFSSIRLQDRRKQRENVPGDLDRQRGNPVLGFTHT